MSTARRAHTLVELLVAIVLFGVGATGLAAALAGDRRLRDLAEDEHRVAAAARERVESLSAAVCAADTSGVRVEPWGRERWRATAGAGGWSLVDSVAATRLSAPLVIEARLPCAP